MADINNLNSGDSSSQYNAYNVGNNVNNAPKVNTGGNSSEYSHGWKRAPRPFGLNVRVPQQPLVGKRTQVLIQEILKEMVMAPIQPIIDFFKDNENVFNGNVAAQIESLQKQQKTTIELLQDADDVVMTGVPTFMVDM